MKIITDPNLNINEVPISMESLEQGDVFRLASISYAEALEKQEFFVKLKHCFLDLSTSEFAVFQEYQDVIVHIANIVVLSND